MSTKKPFTVNIGKGSLLLTSSTPYYKNKNDENSDNDQYDYNNNNRKQKKQYDDYDRYDENSSHNIFKKHNNNNNNDHEEDDDNNDVDERPVKKVIKYSQLKESQKPHYKFTNNKNSKNHYDDNDDNDHSEQNENSDDNNDNDDVQLIKQAIYKYANSKSKSNYNQNKNYSNDDNDDEDDEEIEQTNTRKFKNGSVMINNYNKTNNTTDEEYNDEYDNNNNDSEYDNDNNDNDNEYDNDNNNEYNYNQNNQYYEDNDNYENYNYADEDDVSPKKNKIYNEEEDEDNYNNYDYNATYNYKNSLQTEIAPMPTKSLKSKMNAPKQQQSYNESKLQIQAPNEIHKITNVKQIAAAIAKNDYVMVKFSADWCGPCKSIAPKINKLYQKYHQNIFMGEVDIDKPSLKDFCSEIQSVPQFYFYKNGKGEIKPCKIITGAAYNEVEKYVKSISSQN